MAWGPLSRRAAVAAVLAVGAVACTAGEGAGRDPAPASSAPAAASGGVDTVVSHGTLRIDDETAALDAACAAPGAGEVEIAAVGTLEPSGRSVEVYFQAHLADPYIAVTVDDGGSTELLEASLDERLEVFVTDHRVAAGAIRFVRNLDLDTGSGEFVGFGSIDVDCSAFARDLPAAADDG